MIVFRDDQIGPFELVIEAHAILYYFDFLFHTVNISPFDVFDNLENRLVINAFQAMYPDEIIFKYQGNDILANYRLLRIYLNLFDIVVCTKEALWLEVSEIVKEKHNNQIAENSMPNSYSAEFEGYTLFDD